MDGAGNCVCPSGKVSLGSVKSQCCKVTEGVLDCGIYAKHDGTSWSNDYSYCPEGDIDIPDDKNIHAIGYSAFYKCSKITSVTLPEGITVIREYAFRGGGDDLLESVTFPSTLVEIKYMAFYYQKKLKTLDLSPTKSVYVSTFAFYELELEKLILPGTITTASDDWFSSDQMDEVIYTGSKPDVNLPTCEGDCNEIVCPIGYDPASIDFSTDTCTCPTGIPVGCDNTCGFTEDNGYFTDECGTCDDDPDNNCVQDCNGDWGGSAVVDNCDTCVGGNTGRTACPIDCMGEWGGSVRYDCTGVCGGDASCVYTIIAKDSYGDGWGGSEYVAYDRSGSPTSITLNAYEDIEYTVANLDYVVLEAKSSVYAYEESIEIYIGDTLLIILDTGPAEVGWKWYPTPCPSDQEAINIDYISGGYECSCPNGNPPDVCGVCDGPGVPAGTCDCDGGTRCLASEQGNLYTKAELDAAAAAAAAAVTASDFTKPELETAYAGFCE